MVRRIVFGAVLAGVLGLTATHASAVVTLKKFWVGFTGETGETYTEPVAVRQSAGATVVWPSSEPDGTYTLRARAIFADGKPDCCTKVLAQGSSPFAAPGAALNPATKLVTVASDSVGLLDSRVFTATQTGPGPAGPFGAPSPISDDRAPYYRGPVSAAFDRAGQLYTAWGTWYRGPAGERDLAGDVALEPNVGRGSTMVMSSVDRPVILFDTLSQGVSGIRAFDTAGVVYNVPPLASGLPLSWDHLVRPTFVDTPGGVYALGLECPLSTKCTNVHLWAAGWTTTTRVGSGGNVSVPAISADAVTGALWVAWYDETTRSVYVRETTGDRKRIGSPIRLPIPVGARVNVLTINADRNGLDVLAHFSKGTSEQTRLVHLFHVVQVVGSRQGQTVKVSVTHISRPYRNAAIMLGNRVLGRTGADGTATVTLPKSVVGTAVLTVKDNLKTEPVTLTLPATAGRIRRPGKN